MGGRALRKRYGRSLSQHGISTRPDAFGETAVYSYGEMVGHVRGSRWKATHGAYGSRWHQVPGNKLAAIRALVYATTGRSI